jgi:hypothetical protein
MPRVVSHPYVIAKLPAPRISLTGSTAIDPGDQHSRRSIASVPRRGANDLSASCVGVEDETGNPCGDQHYWGDRKHRVVRH